MGEARVLEFGTRSQRHPAWLRSESVGSTTVTYADVTPLPVEHAAEWDPSWPALHTLEELPEAKPVVQCFSYEVDVMAKRFVGTREAWEAWVEMGRPDLAERQRVAEARQAQLQAEKELRDALAQKARIDHAWRLRVLGIDSAEPLSELELWLQAQEAFSRQVAVELARSRAELPDVQKERYVRAILYTFYAACIIAILVLLATA